MIDVNTLLEGEDTNAVQNTTNVEAQGSQGVESYSRSLVLTQYQFMNLR